MGKKRPSSFKISIRGVEYRVVLTDDLEEDVYGFCDDPKWDGDRVIAIHRRLRGKRRVEIIVHELLHALFWHLSEGVVEEAARDIAEVLWKFGYRVN